MTCSNMIFHNSVFATFICSHWQLAKRLYILSCPSQKQCESSQYSFLCILHNVWLGFLIFIFNIGDMTTSIMLFSLSLILYAILPSLFRNTEALHTFQRKEQLILQWSLEEICLERFLHIFLFRFHICTSGLLPLYLPIESGLSFAPVYSVTFTVSSICYSEYSIPVYYIFGELVYLWVRVTTWPLER